MLLYLLLPECARNHRRPRVQYFAPGVRPLLGTGPDQGAAEADAVAGVPAQGHGGRAQEQPAVTGGENGHHTADKAATQAHQGQECGGLELTLGSRTYLTTKEGCA